MCSESYPEVLRVLRESNVLLVDDNPENIFLLESALDTLGINLEMAFSGGEALEKLEEKDFALILVDVRMPGMTGLDTVKMIRKNKKYIDTYIIFCTAFASDLDLIREAYRLGAVDFITKPFDLEIFREKVKTFVLRYIRLKEVREQLLLLLNQVKECKQGKK